MRIGMYGGSFDPVHLGHINIAMNIMEEFKLDKVIFIPCFKSIDGKNLSASPKHRLAMCKLATKSFANIETSDYELIQNKISYTYQTIKHFSITYPEAELFWIIGSDQAHNLSSWNRLDYILQMAMLIVYPRLDYPMSQRDVSELVVALPEIKPYQHKILIASKEQPYFDISSTTIKQSLQEGQPFQHFLQNDVYTYLNKQDLYKRKL